MDEELQIVCPCCQATLGFDSAGEPYTITHLSEAERPGIRGIVVEEANPGWQLNNYFFNSQREKVKYRPEQLGTLPCIPEAIEYDEPESAPDGAPAKSGTPVDEEELTDAATVLAANTKDLKNRNLT